ncbi:MAG: PH domain-containing protein [Phycisphaeraceae bacterium]
MSELRAKQAGPEVNAPERELWKGGPSQVLNLPVYVMDGAIGLLLIVCGIALNLRMEDSPAGFYVGLAVLLPACHAMWKWLELACWGFELSTQRIQVVTGVLSRTTDDLELYRVRDLTIHQPFWYRIFGLGDIVMETSDRTHPVMTIRAVRKAREVRDLIREHVEKRRMETKTRAVDFEGGDVDAI